MPSSCSARRTSSTVLDFPRAIGPVRDLIFVVEFRTVNESLVFRNPAWFHLVSRQFLSRHTAVILQRKHAAYHPGVRHEIPANKRDATCRIGRGALRCCIALLPVCPEIRPTDHVLTFLGQKCTINAAIETLAVEFKYCPPRTPTTRCCLRCPGLAIILLPLRDTAPSSSDGISLTMAATNDNWSDRVGDAPEYDATVDKEATVRRSFTVRAVQTQTDPR